MVTYDPDVVRWGLQDLVDGVSSLSDAGVSSPGAGSSSIQTNKSAQTELFQQECCPVQGYVKNDKAVVHTLQEEVSQFSQFTREDGEERSQRRKQDIPWALMSPHAASFPECTTDSRELDDQREMAQRLNYDVSAQNVNESDEDIDDDVDGMPTLLEEFSLLDGEVGKHLTHMNSIPHVPRINGEIPTADDATMDHQRLWDRLKQYGLCEVKIEGDGNCQFRAFSDQLYRTPEHHKYVREQVISQFKSHPALYEEYVPMKYSDYLKKMAKPGEWGDHVTLQAAADS
eukprot:c25432_g1_i1 orf=402-1259(+)